MATTSGGIEVIDLTGDGVVEISPEREAPPPQVTLQSPASPPPSPPAQADAENAPQALPDSVAPSQANHSVNNPQGVDLPERLRWMREGRAAATEATSMSDQAAMRYESQLREPEPFIPLPSFAHTGWTALNAPPKLGPGDRLGRTGLRSQRRAEKRAVLARSPSVEFLEERRPTLPTRPTAAEEPSQQNAIGQLPGGFEKLAGATSVSDTSLKWTGRSFANLEYMRIHATAERASARTAHLADAVRDSEELVVYTDGSINKGQYGGGAVVYEEGARWAGRAIALGVMSNSSHAEMSAIYGALRLAGEFLKANQRRLTIVTDSSSCLSWIADRCRDEEWMVPIITAAYDLQDEFAEKGVMVTFRWVKGHAGTLGNGVADKVAGFASAESSRGLKKTYDMPDIEEYLHIKFARRGGERLQYPATRLSKKLERKGAERLQAQAARRIKKLETRRLRSHTMAARARDSRIAGLASQAIASLQEIDEEASG